MEIFGYTLLAVLLVAVLYVILTYNRLVSIKHNVDKAWANIDVLLKQRHDELPKLVEACRQYMKHERETLQRVTEARGRVAEARAAGDVAALGAAEGMLRMGLGQLFAVVENYPELKADQSFGHLQGRITGLENQIADRREYYNETVNINNVAIEVFPDLFVANWFRFGSRELLEFSEAEKADVDLKSLFQ
ncbi:LemA family protein [Endothiovibrio diazotrophicus]